MLRRHSPDIVHRTYYAPGQPAIEGARTVITVYDMIHERFHEQMADDANAHGKRAAIAAADHAICISECTRRDLIELFDVDPAKTSVVHLGFDLMPAGAGPTLATPGREFLLYVGQRAGYKNFGGLLAALAGSPRLSASFDIVCFGGGDFNAAERQAIAAAGLKPGQVRQLGGTDAVLAQLYAQAAVFVYPSLYEGFGIPPLEAMSFGCPVVCGEVASLPEVAGDAASYFQPDEPESLAAAIERVVAQPDYRADLVSRGHQRLKLFSWQRCAEQTFGIYERLLA
jgi:glycosyltransferase involved in cell wall biosynthesis